MLRSSRPKRIADFHHVLRYHSQTKYTFDIAWRYNMNRLIRLATVIAVFLWAFKAPRAEILEKNRFRLQDVFQLQFASDPQISPDGKRVVYVRNFMDIMKDRQRSNLWIINSDGAEHRPLTTGNRNDSSPRWSPDGKRLLYLAKAGETPQLFCRWLDTGQTAQLTRGAEAPANPSWSQTASSSLFRCRCRKK
jgi:hypothetical protein